jgi:large subunit ribosomal protein L15
MDLTTLKSNKGARHKKKRVGRGNASGHGTYSTRGIKGQKARSGGNRRPGFEGGQTPFIQRMPKLKGFKNPNRKEYYVINVKDLNIFNDGDKVDTEMLYKKGLVRGKNKLIKILGDGELTKKLDIKVDAASKTAQEKIKKAQGTISLVKKANNDSIKENK